MRGRVSCNPIMHHTCLCILPTHFCSSFLKLCKVGHIRIVYNDYCSEKTFASPDELLQYILILYLRDGWFHWIDLLMISFSTTFYILRKIHENFTEISSFFWRIYHHKCVINTINDIKSIFEINTINSSDIDLYVLVIKQKFRYPLLYPSFFTIFTTTRMVHQGWYAQRWWSRDGSSRYDT